jgi:hypothetical protein
VTLPITVPPTLYKAIARHEHEQSQIETQSERERVVTTSPEQAEPEE